MKIPDNIREFDVHIKQGFDFGPKALEQIASRIEVKEGLSIEENIAEDVCSQILQDIFDERPIDVIITDLSKMDLSQPTVKGSEQVIGFLNDKQLDFMDPESVALGYKDLIQRAS
jgi:hypothetical protein